MTPTSATSLQLKDDIDSGRTGDKVDFPDPSAAPLGTDEEAGGMPTHPRDLQNARRLETKSTSNSRSNGSIIVMLGVIFGFIAIVVGAGVLLS